jgi:hypothetical protein
VATPFEVSKKVGMREGPQVLLSSKITLFLEEEGRVMMINTINISPVASMLDDIGIPWSDKSGMVL